MIGFRRAVAQGGQGLYYAGKGGNCQGSPLGRNKCADNLTPGPSPAQGAGSRNRPKFPLPCKRSERIREGGQGVRPPQTALASLLLLLKHFYKAPRSNLRFLIASMIGRIVAIHFF